MLNYRISEGKESLIDALLNIQPGKDILIGYGDIPKGAERITLPLGGSGTVIERRGNLIAIGIFAGAAVVAVLYVQKDSQMIRIRPIPHQKMQTRTGEIVNAPEYNRWVERIKTEAPEYLPEWEKRAIKEERKKEGGTDMAEQHEEKPPTQDVKNWMKRALGIEDYKGGRHDRIQMLALLIQNSELGNIRSISDAGSMALALGKDLEYGTPPPYGKSFERYYAEKIAAETGREVPIIKSSDIIKPPMKNVDPEAIANEYLKDFNRFSLKAESEQSDDTMASELTMQFKELSREDALRIAPRVKAIAATRAKEMEEQERKAAPPAPEVPKVDFWGMVKDLKIVDVQVEFAPGEPARGYKNIYLYTYAVLENGKRVRMNEEMFKGTDVAKAKKLGAEYFRERKLWMIGETVGQDVRESTFLDLNSYDEYVKQVPVAVQQRFGETGAQVQGQPKKLYRYYYRNRPPGIGTQPEGFINSEPWLPARTTPHGRTAFGWVEYVRPLTNEETSGFELFEDEVELPRLVRELVQFARDEGIDEAMKAVDAEYGRAVWDWLKAQKRIMPGVGQKEQIRNEIIRLAGITEASQKAPQKASLEDMVKEYKEIGEEMRRLGITTRAGPQADVLMTRENQLWEAIRDIYLEKLEQIPESRQLMPEGLGVLALAGRAATEAVQESPSKVNLEEMLSGWLKGQQVSASIQAARSVEELQPIMEVINFLPLAEIDKRTLIGRYREKYNQVMSERKFGVAVETEVTPKVIGAPSRQELAEREMRRRAEEASRLRGQQKLTSGVSTTRKLEEFGIKERMRGHY